MRSLIELAPARLLAFVAGIALAVGPSAVCAAGFREISVDGVQAGTWYPGDAPTTSQRLGPFDVEIARNAPTREGKHELDPAEISVDSEDS